MLPERPASTPATANAISLYRTTSMPTDAAAISEPRTAKNARPVFVSFRFDSEKSTIATIPRKM